MTDDAKDILTSISLSKVLVAILESLGEVKVPTLSFLQADNDKKEIVMEYDEEGPSFTFKLKEKDENRSDTN